MANQIMLQSYIKNGDFKNLFLKYKNDENLKKDIDTFRAGYYRYGGSGCGECLKCLGATVCLDTLCECGGGDLCHWF